jgi:hypothetical protein
MRGRKGRLAKLLSLPVLAVCGFAVAATMAGVGLATTTTTESSSTPTTTDTTPTTTTTTTPPPGGEGCTPGFWKKPLSVWEPTGISPTATFASVFGVELPGYPGITLVDALNLGGGAGGGGDKSGFEALGRHAVAALLNAAHPDVDFALTQAQVIAAVQGAVAAPATVETVKNMLAGANEAGCPLPNFG